MDEMTEQTRVTLLGNPAKPQGTEGEQMLLRMNDSHGTMTKWAFDFMDVREDDSILDIGCGGGAALARLSKRLKSGHLTGVDYSPVSVQLAQKLNENDIQSGKMEIREASVENLPFADAGFDKIVTVESFYFWPDPAENLKEVYRVLKPAGTFFLTLALYRCADMSAEAHSTIETYKLYVPTIEEITAMLKNAGFQSILAHTADGEEWLCIEGTKPL